ncbi:DUF5057 domain-containing protein [Paenibacillus sp. FSL R10-2736]|uniref:DUF5057 domain-containing protein n=1 Tax=Paenibacillus sp. FSL R10-2736 TaxID=2954692 RepID=UPI0030F679DC
MKSFRRRTWFLVSGGTFSAILIALFVHSFVLSVNAVVDSSYTIRILEITDPTSTASLALDANDKYPKSELDGLQGLANVKIDTMTMKRFVSLRDNWDGKYDAVYIGKGAFSKTLIKSTGSTSEADRKIAHNTTAVENDITLLKAKEITDYYISKGLNVFLREETFSQQTTSNTQGVLYATFNPYRTATRSNVIFLKNLNELNTLTAAIKDGSWSNLSTLEQRPRLTITNKPDNYSEGSATVYKSGDTLVFPIKIDNISDPKTSVRVKLYMNVDSSLPVTEDTVVATKEITSPTDTLSYTLPSTFSGPLYWRMEISTIAGLKDFDTGNIFYKGIKPVIKVLQIMPSGKTDSNLLNSNNMQTSYLSSDNYELQITPKDMSWFNTYITDHAGTSDTTSGLNGKFDMVVFGFQDMYDRVSTPMLSKAAAEAVKAFAKETGQSLMLTHDTIFREVTAPYQESTNNYNYWSPYFHDMVGQALPRTYLGGNAVNPSTKVVSVNQGLLTQYPFNLDTTGMTANRYSVATTHDQFFPLNLERADVIPWYNISGSSRDTDDSYNHFYTYSVGNITFSGTGHTNTRFPEWEQKLFVNTMYRAFTGANHAPDITVYTPQDMSTKPTYQDKLTVSYAATDFDFKDKELITAIQINKLTDKGTYVKVDEMLEKTVRSGETVTQIFNNPLHEDGKLQIQITAKDKQGALATKLITLNVKKVDSNLSISRTLSSDTVERGQPLTITYSVKPNPIPVNTVDAGDKGVTQLVISDIQYSEVFPAYLKFNDLEAEGLTHSGNDASGYTITKNLGNLTYHLSEDGLTYVPDVTTGISFTVTTVPTEKIHYLLDNSNLSFEDLHSLPAATATASATVSPIATASAATAPATASPTVAATATPAPVSSSKIFSSISSISSEFNAFVLGNVYLRSTNTDGRIAAAGDVEFTSYSLYGNGGTLSNSLVVGGNFIFNGGNGATVNGNVAYGGNSTVTVNNSVTGSLTKATPINFEETEKYLLAQSTDFTSLTANGIVGTDLSFVGTDALQNVFNVTASTLNNVKINAPQSSTVVINVLGQIINISGGFDLTNIQNNHIIMNFPQATSLTINGVAVKATVLAPLANVQFDNGQMLGTLIAKSLRTDNGGYLKLGVFNGTLPPVTVATPTPVITPAPTATPEPTAEPTPSPTPAPVLARVTMKFDALSFDAIVKLTGVTLSDATIRVNTSLNMLPQANITPLDVSNPTYTWVSDNPSVATITQEGIVTGVAQGEASITLTVRDIVGTAFSATAKVEVITPALNISGPSTGIVGIPNEYHATYNTVNDTIKGYEWSIKPDSNTAGAVLDFDSTKSLNDYATLVASQSGQVVLIAVAKTEAFPNGSAPREVTVTFTNPVQEFVIEGPPSVKVNDTISLTIRVIRPSPYDPAEYAWSFVGAGRTYATFTNEPDSSSHIKLTGLKITDINQPVVVKASLKGAPAEQPVEAIFNVTVGTRLTDLKLIESIDIGVGKENSRDLCDSKYLTLYPEDIELKDVIDKLEWSSSNPAVVAVSSDGKITGLIKGSAKVTVIFKDDPSIKSSVMVNVLNEDRY